jgi:hypothetical protein
MIATNPVDPAAQDPPPEKRVPEDEEDDAEEGEDGAPAENGANGANGAHAYPSPILTNPTWHLYR